MAGRIAVAAGIAGTVAIVSGIVGVVVITDAGARADDAGSRISVAKIDVAAPAHPTPTPAATADSDIPAPVEPVTVPAPSPGEVVEKSAPKRPTTVAKDHESTPAQGDGHSTSQGGNNQGGNNQGGTTPRGDAPREDGTVVLNGFLAQNSTAGAVDDHVSRGHHNKIFKTQSRKSSPAHRD